jgi:hypothetical protein
MFKYVSSSSLFCLKTSTKEIREGVENACHHQQYYPEISWVLLLEIMDEWMDG